MKLNGKIAFLTGATQGSVRRGCDRERLHDGRRDRTGRRCGLRLEQSRDQRADQGLCSRIRSERRPVQPRTPPAPHEPKAPTSWGTP